METSQPVFFQPDKAWVGDVIPFERDGEFWLFYLREVRDDPEAGSAWDVVTTRDFVTFTDRGAAIPAGEPDAPDFNAYTGSVVTGPDGTDHLFYTGHNPRIVGPDGETPLQIVMHATSRDGLTSWVKHPELSFGATEGYEAGDWRDPFVFKAAEGQPWRMLLAARHAAGPRRRRGVIAQMQSDDLMTWRPVEAFWDPRRYVTHECPDVFPWGDWWYLVYSEFSESFTTRYRMARTVDGPWNTPEHDTIDGRAFYASKSVGHGDRRFFCGWIASKEGSCDDGPYQWAGTMSVLESTQRPDGSLAFDIPSELRASFDIPHASALVDPATSTRYTTDAEVTLSAPDGYACVVSEAPIPATAYASVTVDIAANTTECGIVFRSSADGDNCYILRLEPRRSRAVVDRWPRRVTGEMQWEISGDVPFQVELERPCTLEPGEHTIDIVMDGSLMVAVIDQQVAVSARIYDRTAGGFGLFAGEGTATFRDLRIATRIR